MTKPFLLSASLIALASAASAETIRMSVTTSFANSGLAEVLLPEIEKDIGLTIELLVVGTGQALKLGETGDVDAVLVHSRPAEEAFVSAGFGTHRREIMYNDFVFVGPSSDPAGVIGDASAVEALQDIASAESDAGQPVPRPMPSLAGDLLYTLDDRRLVSVVSWVEGQPLGEAGVRLEGSVDDQVQRHFLLGQLVASIHAATDLLVLPDGFQRHSWDRDGLVGESPVWGRFWDRPNLSSEDRKTLIWARDFLAEALIASQSPTGLIHADVLRENVFVGPGGLSLLDFDDSGFGYRWCPDDLGADGEARDLEAFGHGRRVQRAVPDIGDVARK